MKNQFPKEQRYKPTLLSRKTTCPNGTVPIYRTTEDDIKRAEQILYQMSPKTHNNKAEVVFPNHHVSDIMMSLNINLFFYSVMWVRGSSFKNPLMYLIQ